MPEGAGPYDFVTRHKVLLSAVQHTFSRDVDGGTNETLCVPTGVVPV